MTFFSMLGDVLVAEHLRFLMTAGNTSELTRPKMNFRPSQCKSRLNSDLFGMIFSGLTLPRATIILQLKSLRNFLAICGS